MSISTEVSLHGASHSSRRGRMRATLTAVGVLGMLVSSMTLAAQAPVPQAETWELRFTSGALLPTGDQRKYLKDAQVSAVQLSWAVRPSLAVTGTFGWARSRDLASIATPKLDVFSSDLGVEASPARWVSNRSVRFHPFVGLGAGVRSYNYRKLDVDATHNVAGYGSAGGELAMGRVGLRLEVRDYVAGFKPLGGSGASATRNDIAIMAGLRFNRRRA